MEIEEIYRQASQHHRAGQLGQAESLYRQVLASQVDHADALHGLGYLMHQSKRTAVGVEMIRRAIDLNPENAEYQCHLGVALMALRNIEESMAALGEAIRLRPDHAEAFFTWGSYIFHKAAYTKQRRRSEVQLRLRREIAKRNIIWDSL